MVFNYTFLDLRKSQTSLVAKPSTIPRISRSTKRRTIKREKAKIKEAKAEKAEKKIKKEKAKRRSEYQERINSVNFIIIFYFICYDMIV